MAKVRLILIASVEYEPDPKHYPENATLEEIAKIDAENAENDPYLFLDGSTDIEVNYEIIEEK